MFMTVRNGNLTTLPPILCIKSPVEEYLSYLYTSGGRVEVLGGLRMSLPLPLGNLTDRKNYVTDAKPSLTRNHCAVSTTPDSSLAIKKKLVWVRPIQQSSTRSILIAASASLPDILGDTDLNGFFDHVPSAATSSVPVSGADTTIFIGSDAPTAVGSEAPSPYVMTDFLIGKDPFGITSASAAVFPLRMNDYPAFLPAYGLFEKREKKREKEREFVRLTCTQIQGLFLQSAGSSKQRKKGG
ncbi:hypothetical protein B0H19DRAFT_1077800 [Mycena capillaripes]|nr:hypothetical protein B0H19DRAFT_1077800 [Mycena capillaripes]